MRVRLLLLSSFLIVQFHAGGRAIPTHGIPIWAWECCIRWRRRQIETCAVLQTDWAILDRRYMTGEASPSPHPPPEKQPRASSGGVHDQQRILRLVNFTVSACICATRACVGYNVANHKTSRTLWPHCARFGVQCSALLVPEDTWSCVVSRYRTAHMAMERIVPVPDCRNIL